VCQNGFGTFFRSFYMNFMKVFHKFALQKF